MKKLIYIGVGLVVVLIIAVVVAAMFLGSIVKKGIETAGPQVAKVEIKLDSASISLLSGSGSLKGLFVGNPQGFNSPFAIKAGEISVSVQPSSLTSDKVVVRSVRVLAPEITLHGLGGDNLKKILENVQASTGGASTAKKDEKKEAGSTKIQVDDFLIKDGKVNVVLPMVGAASVALPEIHLTNLGNDSNGLTPDELTSRVLKAVLDSATSVAASAGKGATDQLQKGGKEAGKQLEKATKSVGNLFK